MNQEHSEQCEHIDKHVNDGLKRLEQLFIQRMSAYESNIMCEIKKGNTTLDDFKKEMKPWLEAKIGLALIWRWFIAVPLVIGSILGLKLVLMWLINK